MMFESGLSRQLPPHESSRPLPDEALLQTARVSEVACSLRSPPQLLLMRRGRTLGRLACNMLCYLCGQTITDEPSRDHVPPQQLWSPEIRRQFNVSRLTTLPTHLACNHAYQMDEEYAVRVLASAAYDDSPTARSVVQHGFAKATRGSGVGLHRKMIQSMDARPSGLHLPDGKVLMRTEGARIKRTVWKLIRGLWFLEYGKPLPEDTRYLYDIREPRNEATPEFEEFWNKVRAQPSRGEYQAVFAHKHLRLEQEAELLHGWAMLLWDRVIVYCMHFDPDNPPDMTASGPRGRVALT
jgi:hypothetical protein